MKSQYEFSERSSRMAMSPPSSTITSSSSNNSISIPESESQSQSTILPTNENDDTNSITSTTTVIMTSTPPRGLEAMARITLAGFGGALAGLSVLRRNGSTLGSYSSFNYSLGTRSVSTNLPIAWGAGCMAFAGIVEFSRLISPTSTLIHNILPAATAVYRTDVNEDGTDQDVNTDAFLLGWARTVGDYALGGALAGALFSGAHSFSLSPSPSPSDAYTNTANTSTTTDNTSTSNPSGTARQKRAIGRGKVMTLQNKHQHQHGRTTNTKTTTPPSHTTIHGNSRNSRSILPTAQTAISSSRMGAGRMSIVSGLLPGLALGIVAGCVEVMIDWFNTLISEEEERNPLEQSSQELVEMASDDDDDGSKSRLV